MVHPAQGAGPDTPGPDRPRSRRPGETPHDNAPPLASLSRTRVGTSTGEATALSSNSRPMALQIVAAAQPGQVQPFRKPVRDV